jgi:hypothetical protein
MKMTELREMSNDELVVKLEDLRRSCSIFGSRKRRTAWRIRVASAWCARTSPESKHCRPKGRG